jgi:hypothetical protein
MQQQQQQQQKQNRQEAAAASATSTEATLAIFKLPQHCPQRMRLRTVEHYQRGMLCQPLTQHSCHRSALVS